MINWLYWLWFIQISVFMLLLPETQGAHESVSTLKGNPLQQIKNLSSSGKTFYGNFHVRRCKTVSANLNLRISWFHFVSFAATDKVALLIGNMNYRHHTQLCAPIADVHELTNLLRQMDFKVVSLLDLNWQEMHSAVTEFLLLLDRGVYGQFCSSVSFCVTHSCHSRYPQSVSIMKRYAKHLQKAVLSKEIKSLN